MAAVFTAGVWAGIMDSNRGRLKATPAPRSNLLREMCFLVRKAAILISLFAAVGHFTVCHALGVVLKWLTLHHSKHQRGEAIIVRLRIMHDGAN